MLTIGQLVFLDSKTSTGSYCATIQQYKMLFLIFQAAVMDAPVGNSKCSWGPAYWCSSPEAAIECNVSDYHKQPHKYSIHL